LEQTRHVGVAKSERPRLTNGEIIFEEFQLMWSQFTNVTDRRRDRQTTCDRNTALCTKVHRAVKIKITYAYTTAQILTMMMIIIYSAPDGKKAKLLIGPKSVTKWWLVFMTARFIMFRTFCCVRLDDRTFLSGNPCICVCVCMSSSATDVHTF